MLKASETVFKEVCEELITERSKEEKMQPNGEFWAIKETEIPVNPSPIKDWAVELHKNLVGLVGKA